MKFVFSQHNPAITKTRSRSWLSNIVLNTYIHKKTTLVVNIFKITTADHYLTSVAFLADVVAYLQIGG
jgi:hypothetical protein